MDFREFVLEESKKEYFTNLMDYVDSEYDKYTCYPKRENILRALQLTPLSSVKAVILGQDPYHEPDQAHGLAFSVLCDKLPPSLRNIYKEMEEDLGVKVNQNGNLEYLAKNGVLLLNTCLTVREASAGSHRKHGWETFTDNIIKLINKEDRPIVFILWGADAIKKASLLDNPNHLVITSNHPSPLSAYRGFFGSKPFSKTNEFLKSKGVEEIKWVNS